MTETAEHNNQKIDHKISDDSHGIVDDNRKIVDNTKFDNQKDQSFHTASLLAEEILDGDKHANFSKVILKGYDKPVDLDFYIDYMHPQCKDDKLKEISFQYPLLVMVTDSDTHYFEDLKLMPTAIQHLDTHQQRVMSVTNQILKFLPKDKLADLVKEAHIVMIPQSQTQYVKEIKVALNKAEQQKIKKRQRHLD